MNENYFDNAASTPVDPIVVQEMLPFLTEAHGNAHSIHSAGMRAMQAVELARERVAALIGAEDPDEVVFTSGATESNNWVLRSYGKIAIGPFEHPSVAVTGCCVGAEVLGNEGETIMPPTSSPDLVSVMWVNNEMGGILDVPACRTWARNVHSDLTQAVGKVPFDLKSICFGSLSAHKFYGPKGVGALYAHGGCNLDPLLAGGGQEHGARAGTLNVPGIVGMGAAAAVARDRQEQDFAHATELRAIVLDELSSVSDWRENRCTRQSPFVLNLSFLGLVGEALVVELDCVGFAVSAASACKSSSHGTSGVLTALGVPADWAKGALRISFGRSNTKESARALGVALREGVASLRAMR
ncbi:MAG: cysteine desulfurase [Fimbriimonadaceae bacterium]|nr:cysteine desulfurase [Fimbriimonadaceae bacterium]